MKEETIKPVLEEIFEEQKGEAATVGNELLTAAVENLLDRIAHVKRRRIQRSPFLIRI